ncbi:glycosyltransferase [Aliiroseovarius sp. PTFE2010]|uniref:glycosyltransferase n=1 Tax=Aliiroseovarius sp. PTFE2010 TaxID=3417190 RepID=UPI003CFB90CE
MYSRLYDFGEGRLPSSHLETEKCHLTLLVDVDGASDTIAMVERLRQVRDGRIMVLSHADHCADAQELPPETIISNDYAVNAYLWSENIDTRPLPQQLVRYLFNTNLRATMAVDGDGCVKHYQRPECGDRNVLFVSPGSIYPLSMGSHQRMFDSLMGLAEAGYDIDVVFPRRPMQLQASAEAALRLIARDVEGYKPQKGKLKGDVKRRRDLLDRAAKLLKQKTSQKPTLAETTQTRSSFWLRQSIDTKVENRNYDLLWVNYAWMMGQVSKEISSKFGSIVCDTHDVQFYRDAAKKHWLDERFFSKKYLRAYELELLQRADHVLAISDRDYGILKDAVRGAQVHLARPSFVTFERPVHPLDMKSPITFGFIGTGMDANVQALEFVLTEWWPRIHAYSPKSTFRIAGSVCSQKQVMTLALMEEQVELLGFVDNLSDFYEGVDALLSPVLVKGGLNFKNIEAIVAGKQVFTNAAGAEPLSDLDLPTVENSDHLIDLLRAIEADPSADADVRRARQAKALNMFRRIDLGCILEKEASAEQ